MTGSIPYFVEYVIERPAGDVTFIMAGFLIGALGSIPFWLFYAKKVKDNQYLIIIGGVLLAGVTVPFIFLRKSVPLVIGNLTLNSFNIFLWMILWGSMLGLFWSMTGPVMADVVDEIVVKTKVRKEGTYMGLRAFFGRLAYVVQALSFAIVHEITGFIEQGAVADQPAAAILGIRVHMGLIPVICMVLGTIIFMFMNTLNPKKNADIKKQLEELKL